MSRLFLVRLVLDLIGAGLLLVGFAYWWLGNAAHEFIGTGFFMLLIAHNVFNRRWYAAIPRSAAKARSLVITILNLSLLTAMAILLVTSLLISQTVFDLLPSTPGVAARQLHTLAAYWALVIAGIHLGLNWPIVMGAIRKLLKVGYSTPLAWFLRIAAFGIAVYGVHSSFVIGIGSKLAAQISIEFWDFEQSTIGFFVHHIAIVGLYAWLGYYGMIALRRVKGKRSSAVGRA